MTSPLPYRSSGRAPSRAGSQHPLLRRRRGEEPVTSPRPLAERALEAMMGVALWQERAMMPAIDCAGLSPGGRTGCARRWPPSTPPPRRSPSCAAASWAGWPTRGFRLRARSASPA
ncbi:hypothetical protein [Streptomyces scabichelini]|uniref:hypothetical protein n=1 Tax=Streptomyces scabichelini TaxID=2711217 RepID=UPI001F49B5AD|nr:hypothetical protein [Streptomyces scabichelini]